MRSVAGWPSGFLIAFARRLARPICDRPRRPSHPKHRRSAKLHSDIFIASGRNITWLAGLVQSGSQRRASAPKRLGNTSRLRSNMFGPERSQGTSAEAFASPADRLRGTASASTFPGVNDSDTNDETSHSSERRAAKRRAAAVVHTTTAARGEASRTGHSHRTGSPWSSPSRDSGDNCLEGPFGASIDFNGGATQSRVSGSELEPKRTKLSAAETAPSSLRETPPTTGLTASWQQDLAEPVEPSLAETNATTADLDSLADLGDWSETSDGVSSVGLWHAPMQPAVSSSALQPAAAVLTGSFRWPTRGPPATKDSRCRYRSRRTNSTVTADGIREPWTRVADFGGPSGSSSGSGSTTAILPGPTSEAAEQKLPGPAVWAAAIVRAQAASSSPASAGGDEGASALTERFLDSEPADFWSVLQPQRLNTESGGASTRYASTGQLQPLPALV
jgi:hypothetical protein